MRVWLLLLACACDQGAKPAPKPTPTPPALAIEKPRPEPVCVRRSTTRMSPCSGVPVENGSYMTEVCDECTDDNQCTWKPGGKCTQVGDNICFGPRRWICKYPDARCGNQICPEPEYTLPPAAAPHRLEPPPAPR